MRKILPIITIILCTFLFINHKVSAQIINKEYERVYTVMDDHIEVKESKRFQITGGGWYITAGAEEVFTLFNPVKNDPLHNEKLQRTQNSITLSDNLGNKLTYITELSEGGNIILKVKFPVRIDASSDYTIFLSYSSYGLIIKNARLRDVYIPSFSLDYQFQTDNISENVTTKVVIPKQYGNINFATPHNILTDEGDNHVITFAKESLVGETGWIQIGTEQLYKFKITQPYEPTTQASFFNNKYKVLIPRDINSGPISQTVFFTNVSPTPSNAYYDKDKNLFLEFSIPASQRGEIVIEGYSKLKQNNSVNFKDSGNLSNIPNEILQENTSSAKFWETDSDEILETANTLKSQVKGSDKNIYELVSNTYKFVIDKIDYSEVKRFGINERQGALATLKGGAAVCMEYSDLFIALMRAQGVPARAAFGYGYSALDSNEETQTINHQWAEVYIPSLNQWVSVDTTWGESGQELIGGDLNHFYTHVASESPEIPSTTEVEFYGLLGEIPSKIMSVTATENLPSEIGYTGKDLFDTYNNEESPNHLGNLIMRIRLFVFEIDNSFTNALKTNFAGISEITINFIKVLPFVLIGGIISYRIFKRFRKRKFALEF